MEKLILLENKLMKVIAHIVGYLLVYAIFMGTICLAIKVTKWFGLLVGVI